jgi:ubiquinone/menaquinone biosynthesis C-methylase UbiE
MADEEVWRELRDAVIRSYSAPDVVERYRERMTAGLRRWEEALLELVHTTPDTAMVVGCGTGRDAFALEERGWKVIAVDVTEALLEMARAEAASRRSAIQFERTDGTHLPVADSSVAAVTLWSQVLNNVPTRAGRVALMQEVRRALAPGAVVTFSVHDRSRTLPQLSSDQIVSLDEPEPGDLVLREREGGVTRLNHYFDEDEIRSLCTHAGLQVVQLWHSSDLGEAWNNLFIVAARGSDSGP